MGSFTSSSKPLCRPTALPVSEDDAGMEMTVATFVLIHGDGDVGWYWHLVERELWQRDRRHGAVSAGPGVNLRIVTRLPFVSWLTHC